MIEAEYHPDMFLALPMLAISREECGNPECRAEHWMLHLGWLVFSIHIIF